MDQPSFAPDATLDELLDRVGQKFTTEFETVKIGSHEIQLLQIADMESYVDHLADSTPEGKTLELPFWARIWPTSILLGYYVQRLDPANGPDMLEIGTGVGLCGLIAARHGFNVTISDINEDALLFCRINILKNKLQERCRVARIDFTTDRLDRRFHRIIGSEVLYRDQSYRQLVKFLYRHLKQAPGAEAVIAKDYQLKAAKFFKLARETFRIQEQIIGFKTAANGDGDGEGAGEKQLSAIYRLTPKTNAGA